MTNRFPEIIVGSCGSLSDKHLQLGESHLNGIEIGAVFRQEEQPFPLLFDATRLTASFVCLLILESLCNALETAAGEIFNSLAMSFIVVLFLFGKIFIYLLNRLSKINVSL